MSLEIRHGTMAVAIIFLPLLSLGHGLALTVPWTLPLPLLRLILELSLAEDEVTEFLFCLQQQSEGYFSPLFDIISDDSINIKTVMNTV